MIEKNQESIFAAHPLKSSEQNMHIRACNYQNAKSMSAKKVTPVPLSDKGTIKLLKVGFKDNLYSKT